MADEPFTSIPPSTRILDLASINTDVSALLTSAGLAIAHLTPNPSAHTTSSTSSTSPTSTSLPTTPPPPLTLEEQKDAFKTHSTTFFIHLQSISARLRRQAYALEEAGIIAAEAPRTENRTVAEMAGARAQGQGQGQQGKGEKEMVVTNGGMGNLDVGWLNSRGGGVGRGKERELMREVEEVLKAWEGRMKGEGAGKEGEGVGEEEGEGMDVS